MRAHQFFPRSGSSVGEFYAKSSNSRLSFSADIRSTKNRYLSCIRAANALQKTLTVIIIYSYSIYAYIRSSNRAPNFNWMQKTLILPFRRTIDLIFILLRQSLLGYIAFRNCFNRSVNAVGVFLFRSMKTLLAPSLFFHDVNVIEFVFFFLAVTVFSFLALCYSHFD